MNEIKNSIISSTVNYLNKLQYLAVDDKKTSGDIILLIIADDVFEWASWHEASQTEQLKIQNLRKKIIRNNPNIVDIISRTNEFYKNVNLPQTLYTWQRVYDNFNVQTIDNPSGIVNPPFVPPYFYGVVTSTSKPSKNQALINSGNIVYDIDVNSNLILPFDSTINQFSWFAIPATASSKAFWFVDETNNGDIGGNRNLFDTEITITIRIPNTLLDIDYKIYSTNYATDISSITVSTNQII